MQLKKCACRTANNKSCKSRKRHPSATPSLREFLGTAVGSDERCQVDRQLNRIRSEHSGRRKPWQIELDHRTLSGHRRNSEHAYKGGCPTFEIGERTEYDAKCEESREEYGMENQQCSQCRTGLFLQE